MKLVLLDGGGVVGEHVARLATEAGADVSHFRLEACVVAPCLGDFDCWVKTPGLCRSRDVFQDIVQQVHDADVLVYTTPLTFGGYGSTLKRVVDRLIGLVTAFFEVHAGLSHHQARYRANPGMLVIGWSEREPDAEARAIFREIAAANGTNQHAPWLRSEVFGLDGPWHEPLAWAVKAALEGGPADPPVHVDAGTLPEACRGDAHLAPVAPARVAVLVGSPRPTGQSTSESLARELLVALKAPEVTFHHALPLAKDGAHTTRTIDALADADLLVVASPLYVDALPSVATRALELLSRRLASGPARLRRVVGLLNCGFPEATHTRSAMRLVRAFTHQSGLEWAGGLALGGGEAVHGRPVDEVRWMLRGQLQGLASAGQALARGEAVPPDASAAMAQPLVWPRFYRWLATFELWRRARRVGNGLGDLHSRPLDVRR